MNSKKDENELISFQREKLCGNRIVIKQLKLHLKLLLKLQKQGTENICTRSATERIAAK